jgi:hypothetical protein
MLCQTDLAAAQAELASAIAAGAIVLPRPAQTARRNPAEIRSERAIYCAERRDRLKAAGLCIVCGGRKVGPPVHAQTATSCLECRALKRKRLARKNPQSAI